MASIPLPRMVADTAEKLGSIYVGSREVGPWIDRNAVKPNLPLRLGARVRDVFIAGGEQGTLQAVRGQLIMHRSLQAGKIVENGFFILLSKDQANNIPLLTFGKTNIAEPGGGESTAQIALEVLLSASEISWRSLGPIDVDAYREQLQGFDVEAIISRLEESAKALAANSGKQWQEVFKDLASNRQTDSDTTLQMIEKLFQLKRIPRRFRRDTYAKGILRQNEEPYVDGQDCSQVAAGLQAFFDGVHQPIQTRMDQKIGAITDLEHGTQLEKVDPSQISEIDVARSVVRNWRRTNKPDWGEILPIPYSMFPYHIREHLIPDYSKYPELKDFIDAYAHNRNAAVLEHDFPGVAEALNCGSDSVEWQTFQSQHPDLTILATMNVMNTHALYNGENSGVYGFPWDEFDRLMTGLSKIKAQPSIEAFPYD